MGRVFVIGSLNLDTVLAVERHPAAGETVSSSSVATLWGGKGANQAVAAARATGSRVPVVMIGCIGADEAGARYRDRLAAEGVDALTAARRRGRADGRRVHHGRPARREHHRRGRRRQRTHDGIRRLGIDDAVPGDVVVASLEVPLEVVVAAARVSGERRALHPQSPPGGGSAGRGPRRRRSAHRERARSRVSAFEAHGEESVLVTRGAAGSVWGDVAVPAMKDVDVVDTTGAGDAYCRCARGRARGGMRAGRGDDRGLRGRRPRRRALGRAIVPARFHAPETSVKHRGHRAG